MKRPSNLIIAFIIAIAGTFLLFALGRIVIWVFPPSETEIEVEEDYESRQQGNRHILKS